MSFSSTLPSHPGQLVWCPADPALGVGIVEALGDRTVTVRFLRLEQTRQYTTRGSEQMVARYPIGTGEKVDLVAGGTGRVQALVDQGGRSEAPLACYRLDDGTEQHEQSLRPHVRDVDAKERLAGLTLVHPEVVRARMRGLSLAEPGGRAGIGGLLGARAQLLPHQVDVAACALLRDPIRALLADEVGLGKTVEAALIYAALRREGRANRVLVLTPEALCIQWLQELYRKSHELLVLLDGPRIEDAERDFPGLNPFEAHQRMVASIDRVAGDSILAALAEAAPWDLVIVDEAHHLRGRSSQGGNPAYRLLEGIARRTKHLLLLTATPMALDPAEYHVLLRLLDPVRFDAPGVFADVARRARDLSDVARGLQQSVAAGTPVSAETKAAAAAALRDDAEDSAAVQALLGCEPGAANRLALLSPVLAALRDRHALADYVTRNRRGPVGGLPVRHAELFALPLSDAQALLLEVGEDIVFELVQAVGDARARGRIAGELLRALWATPRSLIDVVRPYSEPLAEQLLPHVRAVTEAPVDANGLPSGDTRLAWLVQQCRKLAPGDKLLVFVEGGVAVRALKEGLEPFLQRGVATFHGELSARDQDRQVAYFRDPSGPQVMLSTEAGGEGRNFQFCNKVVLYDLPWRPATIEQRIGRVDRVGQSRDVHVLVPHADQGFEAAVVKIMQQAIGVLERTVGGIDHALEYVEDRLAGLILAAEGADAWKALFRDTQTLVGEARRRIEADVDPVLDHASFAPERAEAVLATLPHDVEARLESFVYRYASHSKLEVHAKGQHRVVVEGAPSAAGDDSGTGYIGSFARQDALDHEDLDFLSYGHPLVEQAFDWARHGHEASAALALCRGFEREGAAFLWTFAVDVPDDVPQAAGYFAERTFTLAVDEAGERRLALESLLADDPRELDRMDPTPLRGNLERWRLLVERNYEVAERLAEQRLQEAATTARARCDEALRQRRRHLERAAARSALVQGAAAGAGGAGMAPDAASQAALQAHAEERARLWRGLQGARPRLLSVVALRMLRARHVSA